MRKITLKSVLMTALLAMSANAMAEEWSYDFVGKVTSDVTITVSAEVVEGSGLGSISFGEEAVNSNFLVQTGTNWLMRTGGLYQFNGGGRAFGINNVKAGQIITIVVNAEPGITSNATKKSSDGNTHVFTANEDGYVKFSLARYLYIYSVSVADPSASAVNYTVNFVDENGDAIKDPIVYDGEPGDKPSVPDGDKAAIYNSDNTVKYGYVSDDSEDLTIASDGSTVVTVRFAALSKYNYSVKAVAGGADLKVVAEGSVFEDEDVTAYYPAAIDVEGKWYTVEPKGTEPYFGVALDKDNATAEVEYALNNSIVYFSEGNALSLSGSFAAATPLIGRVSNGDASRLSANSYAYTAPLAAGTYNLYVRARSQRAAAGNLETLTLAFRDAEENIIPTEYVLPEWPSASSAFESHEVLAIEVPDGYSIVLQNATEYNSNIEIDYVMLTAFSADQVSFVLGDSESYASYVPAYAADFKASGVEAFVATAADGTAGIVTLESVDAVPAGTPVLVKGTVDNTVEIKKAATAEAPAANLLKAATGAALTENQYVLAWSGAEFVFAPLDGTIELPVGKVYLEVADASVKAFRIAGTATAVESVKAAQADGRIFNLAGQRVNKAQKGIYVVNGKKVVK